MQADQLTHSESQIESRASPINLITGPVLSVGMHREGRTMYGRTEAAISGPARHLRAVDHNGEIEPETIEFLKAEIHRLGAVVRGLERDLRGWMVRYRQLEEDKATEAREHPLWPVAEMLFKGWRKRCNHPRSPFTPDRFWLIEQFLTNPKYGPTLEDRVKLCARAIAGAGFDAFAVRRKNGSVKRMDEWERIFGAPNRWQKTSSSAGSFEEFVNRAPRGWSPTLSDALREAIGLAEARLSKLKEAGK